MQATRARVDFFLARAARRCPRRLIRAVLGSVAQLAVIPLQDLLGLGSEARFNRPGTASGNWQLARAARRPERASSRSTARS